MAEIRTSVSLNDAMSAPLQRINNALNLMLNTFEAVQAASGNVMDVS